MDEDIQSNNACLPLCTKAKRFKQDEYSKVSPAVKNMKLKSCKNRNKRYISTYRYLKKSSNSNYKEVNRNVFYINLKMQNALLPK